MSVINFESTNCKNCYACVRACPVQSIKIKDEQAIIMEERCIACGLCLKACPKNVKKVETELEKVKSYLNFKSQIFKVKGKDIYFLIKLENNFPFV